MPSFTSNTYTINSKTIYYKAILTNHDDIIVADIGDFDDCYTAASGSLYGINGTFFYLGTPPQAAQNDGYSTGDVYRIAIYDTQSERDYGLINRQTASSYGNCGTYVKLINTLPSGRFVFSDSFTDFTNYQYIGESITRSNVRYAIGGINLYLNKTYQNDEAYYSETDVDAEDDNVTKSSVHRSAIVYLGGETNDTLLLTVFSGNNDLCQNVNGLNLFELRTMILDLWGPNLYYGIALDGGGSTQIVYRENNQRKTVRTADAYGNTRKVRTMVCTSW